MSETKKSEPVQYNPNLGGCLDGGYAAMYEGYLNSLSNRNPNDQGGCTPEQVSTKSAASRQG